MSNSFFPCQEEITLGPFLAFLNGKTPEKTLALFPFFKNKMEKFSGSPKV